MNERERVLAALEHRQPDKTPVSIGTTIVDGMSRFALANYEEYCGKAVSDPLVTSAIMQTAAMPEWILQKTGSEFRPVRNERAMVMGSTDQEDGSYADVFGIYWQKSKLYFDPVKGPWYGDLTIEQVESHPWLDPHRDDLYRKKGFRKKCAEIKAAGHVAVVDLVSFGPFESASWMRGYFDLLTDFYENESLLRVIFEKTSQTAMDQFSLLLEEIGDDADIVCHGDDLGMQDRTFFSREMFDKFLLPHYKRLFGFIKSKTKAKIFFHSCGSVFDFIPSLIEAGVDILNPVQTSARNMEPEKLKREFGKDIVFWGGIDTQKMLQNSSEQEIRDEIKRLVDVLGRDGGYVLAPSHNLQESLPPEKIEILLEAMAQFR